MDRRTAEKEVFCLSWKEHTVVEQRKEFIQEYLAGKADSFKSLCQKYGISEKTGHKWKNRFFEYGYAGLCDRSRAPENSPSKLDEDTVIRLIKLRTAHPTWGPKKIAVLYQKAYPEEQVPSESSIYRVLGKAGLIQRRQVRTVQPDPSRMRKYIKATNPNDVWTVDFKGWWYSQGEKCLPLTVRDLASKYILDIRLMQSGTAEAVKAVFEKLFQRYGMPRVIRSDNGVPFAVNCSPLGLTRLSAWRVYLGIRPDRTDPGSPTQNGSHERMHADLSREIQGKIAGGVAANQRAIDAWVEEYNFVRPHESIGMMTPSEVYTKSDMLYEGTPDTIEYPTGFETRKINKHGYVKINKTLIQVSTALRGLTVGLQAQGEREFVLWLGDYPLGIVSTETFSFSCLETKPLNSR